jgi:hypothetical protein
VIVVRGAVATTDGIDQLGAALRPKSARALGSARFALVPVGSALAPALPGLAPAELIVGTLSIVGTIDLVHFHGRVRSLEVELGGWFRIVGEDHVLERERSLPPSYGEDVDQSDHPVPGRRWRRGAERDVGERHAAIQVVDRDRCEKSLASGRSQEPGGIFTRHAADEGAEGRVVAEWGEGSDSLRARVRIGEIHDGRVERDVELERREPGLRQVPESHLDASELADREPARRRLDLDQDRL